MSIIVTHAAYIVIWEIFMLKNISVKNFCVESIFEVYDFVTHVQLLNYVC